MKNRSHNVHAFIHIKKGEQPKDKTRCDGFHCKEPMQWIVMSALEGIQFEQQMQQSIKQFAENNTSEDENLGNSSDDETINKDSVLL